MALFEPVFAALNEAGVRYIVVGGVAVVLHGYARLTADLDLIVDLVPAEARKALDALTGLGLRPRAPVPAHDFAVSEARRRWVEEKGMRVFSLWDPAQPMREVDLFVEHPIEFGLLFARSEVVALATTQARIASIEDLIHLKRMANRPEDQRDIAALEAIRARRASRA
jgi:predicted nucleotidyltransferase